MRQRNLDSSCPNRTQLREGQIIHIRAANVYSISGFRYNPTGQKMPEGNRLMGCAERYRIAKTKLEDYPESAPSMSLTCNRREVLKAMAAASTAIIVPPTLMANEEDERAARPSVEVEVTPVSAHTFRLSILPITKNGPVEAIPFDGSLVQKSWGAPSVKLREETEQVIVAGGVHLQITLHPIRAMITDQSGNLIQKLAMGR